MALTTVVSAAAEAGFIAFNPQTGSTTQGESVEEAIGSLEKAAELYLK